MVLGNVAILVGSGIVGSVLTSDGKIPSVRDVASGVAKFGKKLGKEGGDAKAGSDPHTAQLITQVNYLREELQYLASRPVTVVTNAATSGSGAYTITAVVVAGIIGYAYIKWKGWKLSDMMFVTKRGLSDACNVVGSQLDQVSDSVIVTRKHLAGRIDRVDITLDETQEIIEGTRDEVTVIHGDLSAFQEDLQSVNLVVQSLESKLGCLECAQDQTVQGIHQLCEFSEKMKHGQNANVRQVSSSIPAAIGSSSERIATCLPRSSPRLALEPIPPVAEPPRAETSAESPRAEALQEPQGVVSGTSWTREGSSEPPSPGASSSTGASTSTLRNPSSSSSLFGGLRLPGLGFLRASAS
ncbi:uncharacterized protein LOC133928239 isoform X2 [Phragmites australis]|uniref:uncharacterized protein LOC133928239 isoform X2 n=1 Tax=Phragmites australis TaxID=29695 RepID=UPI002D77A674|nr:uncharacterized protein LOC133928239 isoform X2 [Phragmites australis]